MRTTCLNSANLGYAAQPFNISLHSVAQAVQHRSTSAPCINTYGYPLSVAQWFNATVRRLEGGIMAGSVHKGYRLSVELVERIDAWAEAHDMTQAEAVRRLLTIALDGTEDEKPTADADVLAVLRDNVRDLRQTVATLTAQLSEKDEQIRRVADLADHAQALQAAQAHSNLLEATEAITVQQQVTKQGTAQPTGWRARVARWLMGGED